MRFIVVTGMSGGGRSTALKVLEDAGFYCVDNLPVSLIEKFVEESGFRGQIDIDIFEIEGKYYISEVNPRFGGGYPHAYESGCDHMQLIINNLNGIVNEKQIGNYEEGIYMMKYNEVKVLKDVQ